jgi:murein DD-endopeptidase MepM/ murein hydrolase activator NlpD
MPLDALQTGDPSLPTECDVQQSNFFCVYTVQAGDTLSSIASKFSLQGNENIAAWELLVHSNKPDIVSEDDLLQIGQQLRIPLENGVVHTVLSAQTLSDIAAQYDVTIEAITGVAANGIGNADTLSVGQEILIPSPNRLAVPAVFEPAPSDPAAPADPGAGGSTGGGASSASGFMWPTSGPLSSYFGPSHPLGIDIDLYAAPNAAIGAAMSGTVTFAGGNACCSYGLYVIVDHGNGYQTLYAHMSEIYVGVGEFVTQGQTIGAGGRTGYATGNHLHFEVHINGAIVNPLSYLP